MTASRLAFHPQDVRMASDNHLGGASVDHLLAHLESSKQALEHQVQQLLQENRSSKFAKKEQQWQVESKRLQSELENLSVSVKEKEDRICCLEKELREARTSIQHVQSRCREAEKEKERGALERASLQADVEDAQTSLQSLQREYKSKHDVAEKQRRALESLADKVEKQKEIFQNQLEDARRRLGESEEREHKFEVAAQSASQQMAEKERQLKSLRDAHEKLLAIQRGKQAEERKEVREVIQVLESTQAKCEEQKKTIKDLEQERSKTRKEAHRLDARASAAEANAIAKAALLEKVQLELKSISSDVVPSTKAKAQIEALNKKIETLKRSLQEAEDALSEESALRCKAECTIDEYKLREKSLLKIEQDGKALNEEIKWRNEQFESLEEAHDRMRDQFHDGRTMWESEKAALVREIETLTMNAQSRDAVGHDLRSQVKLLQKSLAHEENCRKLVEFQLADAKAGMESVSAEFLSVQSVLEMLRVNSKTELSDLRGRLTEKDKHLKELQDKQRQVDHEQKLRLTDLEAELDNYKSSCEHLKELQDKQKQMDNEQKSRLTELEAELDMYKRNCEHLKELYDKQRQMDHNLKMMFTELEAELDTYKSSCEHLKELQDKQRQIDHEQKLRLIEVESELDTYKRNCEQLTEVHDKQKRMDHDQKLRLSELEAEFDNYRRKCEHLEELQDTQRQMDHEQKLKLTRLEAQLGNYRSSCAHLKELQDKQEQIDHDQKLRLTELEAELDNYRSSCERLKELQDKQEQIDHDQKLRLTELEAELDNYRSSCERLKELQDKQQQIDHEQKLRLTELEAELDDYKSSCEHLKEQKEMDHGQKLRLAELEAELDNYKSNCEHLQHALENRAEQEMFALEIKRDDVMNSQEREHLIQSLSDAETAIAAYDVEMKELKMELDGAHTLAELLRTSLAEAEANSLEEKNSLKQAIASLFVKQHEVMELELKLEKLRAVVSECKNDVRECKSEAEAKVIPLEEGLFDAPRELQGKRSLDVDDVLAVRPEYESLRQLLYTCETQSRELKKHHEALIAGLGEKKIIYQKEKQELLAKLEHFGKRCLMKESQLSDLHDQIERQKELISSLEARCSTSEQELSKQLALVDHAHEEVDVWKLNAQRYKETDAVALLEARLSDAQRELQEKESLLNRALLDVRKKEDGVVAVRSECESLLQQLHDCETERRELEKHHEALVAESREKNLMYQKEKEELLAKLEHLGKRCLMKDSQLSDLHDRVERKKKVISTLEARCSTSEQELTKQLALVDHVREEVDVWKLNAQAYKEKAQALDTSEAAAKDSSLEEIEGTLQELKREAKDSRAIIDNLNKNLKTAKDAAATRNEELHELRKELESKSMQLLKLNAERDTSLGAEATAKDSSLEEIKGTLQELTREVKESKVIIDNLNKNLRTAEDAAATRDSELHELRKELESKSVELLSIGEQTRALEDKLRETEAVVHDQEQRLHASEWTVEQLASEIAKSKSFLTQKQKNEVVSKDRLSHVETHLKEKEREFIELHCDLENAVKTSNERYTAVQQLTCSMEELTYELDSTRRALKETTVALAASEAEVKRVLEVQRSTEAALATCKECLSDEVKTNAARENDMNRLCEDMECAKQESTLADAQVKKLQEQLKCLERTTQARLESYGGKLEKDAADLIEYKANCAGLMELIDKKDALVHDLESKVEHGRRDLAKKEQELASVTEQLDTEMKIQSNLKVELATADDIIKQLDLNKRGLEEELQELRTAFSLATEAVKERTSELEQQRRSIERLESLAEAQVAKVKELTSNAAEERDNKISRLQTALDKAHEDLQSAYELVSAKDGEKYTLSSRLSEMDAAVEKSKSQISQLQALLQLARANLEAETERVWQQVAARTEIETKRDSWKAKAAALSAKNSELEIAISKLETEVNEWKEVAEHTENLTQIELETWKVRVATFETSLQKWKVEAEEWKEIAENTQLLNAELEKSLHAVGDSVTGWEKVVTSVTEEGDVTKRHLEFVLKQVHEEFRCLQQDLVSSKDLICSEGRVLKTEFLTFLTDSHKAEEAEVETWRQKAAAATEEGLQMKSQFEELLKSLQGELKTWKQFDTLAREERRQETAPTRAEGGDTPDVFTSMSINPFHQEDEGCSSGLENDDAAQQLNGWKSKSSAVAKEGRKLTRQFRASFKHLQFELESRKQQAVPPRMAKHESFVHRHENTGLEELVKALQEEAVEVKVDLARWKSKATELEKTITKLNAEVEVWKDRSAMSAGQRIVARRQLDDYAKQVKSLNADLQKWKDVATEVNECETKLQTSLETLQKDHEDVRTELNEWMQKALEFNCKIKDLEKDLEESRRKADDLEVEVEKWKEDGKSATMELVDTLGKFEDELEVMSSNSIGSSGRSLREEDLDCTSTWQRSPSGRFSNEWRPELETEKEKLEIQQQLETTVKEMEALKKSAEDREKNLTSSHATEVLSLQAELDRWKATAAEAAQECTSVLDLVKELQSELAQWKEKSETATKEATSVKASLENIIQDLEHQVRMWKQKAEGVLEYEDLIKALEEELCLWTQRVKDGKALQLELEQERAQLREALTVTQTELQKWKDRVAAVLEEEGDDVETDPESELQKWKSKAIGRELLKDMLAVTLNELQEWKLKATELGLMAEALKEELIIVIEEGRLETEELSRSSSHLDPKISDTQRCEEKVA